MDAAKSLAERSLEQLKERKQQIERWEQEELSSSDCSVCAKLLHVCNSPKDDRIEVDLGTLRDILQNGCENHRPAFPANDALTDQHITARRPKKSPLLYFQPNPFGLECSKEDRQPWELLDVNHGQSRFSKPEQRPQPRLVDEDWIDLDLPKQWLARCEEKHGGGCCVTSNETFQQPSSLLVVDTVQKCLVDAPPDCRYVALSYVWGSTNAFVTTPGRLPSLRRPGALDQSLRNTFRLPRTVAQAMELVRALGETYLWVDVLCVMDCREEENDVDDGDEDHRSMASIFAHAAFTIVAADAPDADHGFRGLPNISEPRQILQRTAQLSATQKLVQPSSSHVWDNDHLKPWSRRAWTYQEAVYSHRLLIFANQTMRWSCAKARWSEESTSSDCISTYGSTKMGRYHPASLRFASSRLPRLDEYERLVSDVNSRKLASDDDAYDVFAGIANQLGRKFRGGLISGLPEQFFDLCLLWRPSRAHGPARRRLSSDEQQSPLELSWSWMGWETGVTFPYTWNHSRFPAGAQPAMLGNSWVARQMRPMRLLNNGEEGSSVVVHNDWATFGKMGAKDPLPAGWSRLGSYSAPGTDPVALEEYRRLGDFSFFAHESEPSLEFCFPVQSCVEPTPPRMLTWLQFSTESGMFKLGEIRGPMTRIHTLSGEPAGTLWQHDEDDEGFLQATTGPLAERPSIELIMILGCSYPKSEAEIWDTDELLRDEYLEGKAERAAFEIVANVLWIERAENVAYRKASGVVYARTWYDAPLRPVEVTLS